MQATIAQLFHFRSLNHACWFLGSMAGLICLVLIYWRAKNGAWFLGGVLAHLGAFLQSILVVVIFKEGNEVFSMNCVWFNGGMVGLYIILFGLAWLLRKKKIFPQVVCIGGRHENSPSPRL